MPFFSILDRLKLMFFVAFFIFSYQLLLKISQKKVFYPHSERGDVNLGSRGGFMENNTEPKPIRPPKQYVFFKGGGRLGNQLFGYASTVGIADTNNRKAIFDNKMTNLKDLFPSLDINTKGSINTKGWARIKEVHALDLDKRFLKLHRGNVTILSYLQSFKYFKGIESTLFNQMSHINEIIKASVDRFTGSVKKKASARKPIDNITTVCIHVRRGDYTQRSNNKFGRRLPSAEEIKFAMKYMESTSKHVVFIATSEDKRWCEEHLGGDNVYISPFTSHLYDFALLQSCDHMIMTVGTYGWWAAWLTSQRGGTALYYRKPFEPKSVADRMFNRHNHFPGHWLAYDNKSVVESLKLKD